MSVPAKQTERNSASRNQNGLVLNTAVSPEKEAARRETFWAGAMESPSLLYWIVTHLPRMEQPPIPAAETLK